MALRAITTKEATIRTATVALKTLAISGKQVTLSVFRQLIDEDLIDPYTGKLNGVPWGTVNYFWGDCEPDHLHVVWQKGSELRRACTYPDSSIAKLWRSRAKILREQTLPTLILVLKMTGSEISFGRIGRGDDSMHVPTTKEFDERPPVYIMSHPEEDSFRIGRDRFGLSSIPDLTISNLPPYEESTYPDERGFNVLRLPTVTEWQAMIATMRKHQEEAQVRRATERARGYRSSNSDYAQCLSAYSLAADVLPDSEPFDEHQQPENWRDWWKAAGTFREAAELYEQNADQLKRAWKQHYAEVSALDQLFIAV